MVDYLDEFKLFLNEDNGDNGNNDNNNNVKKFVEDKEIYEIVDNESVFTINSKDRNLINETAFDFSINFGTNNPNKINIGKNFRNIVSVEFLGLIIPDFYVDIKELLTLYNKKRGKKHHEQKLGRQSQQRLTKHDKKNYPIRKLLSVSV